MSFNIANEGKEYYIESDKLKIWSDASMAHFLSLYVSEYHEILIKCGAIIKYTPDLKVPYSVFYKIEDAQRAIEELEPHLIMKELMK